MIDFPFLLQTFLTILPGVPKTLGLAASAVALGFFLAFGLAVMRTSRILILDWTARAYIAVFRGTPLLVQIFLIYYGVGQFPVIRSSFLWPFLREPQWCAILSLTLNTAAYAGEVIRGGLQSVPRGHIEAAKACGMSRLLLWRRIMLPVALRQALPGYGNEMIGMIKATSITSLITIMEISGLASKIISETYRVVEVFLVAGLIYLAINLVLTRLLQWLDYRLTPHLRERPVTAVPMEAIA
jgi:octopine/nopaline transport system permease protein